MISMAQFFFCYFAAAIVVSAGLAVTLRNPVHSVLLVLVMFYHMAGIYLTLNAEFLAAVQVIVYAGAVLVLYLFVLFLMNLKDEIRQDRTFIRIKPGSAAITAGVFTALFLGIRSFVPWPAPGLSLATMREAFGTKTLGVELFSTYLLPFEITGIILLVAVVGGVVLARGDDTPNAEDVGLSQEILPLEEMNQ